MSRDRAEATAILALQHIAEDGELLGRFLALTGCGPADIRARATEPDFLGAVLDFVLGDEALVTAIADRFGFPAETPMAARQVLPGAIQDI